MTNRRELPLMVRLSAWPRLPHYVRQLRMPEKESLFVPFVVRENTVRGNSSTSDVPCSQVRNIRIKRQQTGLQSDSNSTVSMTLLRLVGFPFEALGLYLRGATTGPRIRGTKVSVVSKPVSQDNAELGGEFWMLLLEANCLILVISAFKFSISLYRRHRERVSLAST